MSGIVDEAEELPSVQKFRVGLVVDYLVSEFCELLLEGVQRCGQKYGIDIYLFPMGTLNNRARNYDYQYVSITAFLNQNNLDGLIFVSGLETHYITAEEFISYIKSFNPLPVVNIGAVLSEIPSIVIDAKPAYKALVEHVIESRNAKKIAIMSAPEDSEVTKLRESIIFEVLEEHSIPRESVTVWRSNFSYSSAMHTLSEFASCNPACRYDFDAVFALNDDMAICCIDFFKERGISVPDDLVVAGFDDLKKASFNSPSISTVSQRVMTQGYVAARSLYDIMMKKKVPFVQTIDCKAILRESTDAGKYINKIKNSEFIELDRAALAGMGVDSTVAEWYNRRNQIYRIAKFHADIRRNLSEDELMYHLAYGIQSLAVNYVAVVAFDKAVEMLDVFEYFHLPHAASVFCYNNSETGTYFTRNDRRIVFDPNKSILPAELLKSSSNPFIGISLYSGSMQYGYMLVEKSNYDLAFYDLFSKAVSSILSVIYSNTEVIKIQEQIRRQCAVLDRIAHTDELTGVLNRRGLGEFGQQALDLEKSMRQSGMVVYCDMNGLRQINDFFGHESGDKAIVAEAEIFSRTFRLNDVVARVTGDKFVAICPGMTQEACEKICSRIEKSCMDWTTDTNSLFVLSLALCGVKFPLQNGSYELEDLLEEARQTMRAQKKS